jgi:hypothetical protein
MAEKRTRDGNVVNREMKINNDIFSRCNQIKNMRSQLIYAHGGSQPGDDFRIYVYDSLSGRVDAIAVPRQNATVATLMEGMTLDPREQLFFRGQRLVPSSTPLHTLDLTPECVVTVITIHDEHSRICCDIPAKHRDKPCNRYDGAAALLELDAELAHLQQLIDRNISKLTFAEGAKVKHPSPIPTAPFPPGRVPSMHSELPLISIPSLANSDVLSEKEIPVRKMTRVIVRGGVGRQITTAGTITNHFSGNDGIVTMTVHPDGSTSVERHENSDCGTNST